MQSFFFCPFADAILCFISQIIDNRQIRSQLVDLLYEKNEIAISAQKLKDKILRYGKTFQSNGEDCVTILLFQNELLLLLKILLLIVSV